MWSKIKSFTVFFLGWLAIIVLLVLVLDVLWGVYTRKVMGDQARWTEELARFLLVWISFLGTAIAYLDDKHLGVDILVSHFDKAAKRVSRVFTHVLVLAFSLAVMGIGGTRLCIDRFDSGQLLPSLDISKGWFYLSVPVSGYLIAFFALGNVISLIMGKGVSSDSEEVSS